MLNLTLTSVVFELAKFWNGKFNEYNLTLTSVVFELIKRFSLSRLFINLTLTSVVFELSFYLLRLIKGVI